MMIKTKQNKKKLLDSKYSATGSGLAHFVPLELVKMSQRLQSDGSEAASCGTGDILLVVLCRPA